MTTLASPADPDTTARADPSAPTDADELSRTAAPLGLSAAVASRLLIDAVIAALRQQATARAEDAA